MPTSHSFRRVTFFAAALLIMTLFGVAQKAPAAITLTENFDAGSLDTNSSYVSGTTVTLIPRKTSPGTYGPNWWWSLTFRADGVLGLTPQFRIPQPLCGLEDWDRFVYSYDNVNWQYFDNGTTNGGAEYDFSNNAAFTQNTVYVSIMFAYPTWKTDGFVASVKGTPYVKPTLSADANLIIGHTPGTVGGDANGVHYLDDMGRTVPSLPLYGFKITDSNATGTKTKIIVDCGNHSGEPLSAYVMEGLVNWLIGTSPEANALRKAVVFYIYPCLDPEGRYSGYYVSSPINPNGNHNRMWYDPSLLLGNPEVLTVQNAMRADTGGGIKYYLDMHVDWHDSMLYGTNAMLGSLFAKCLAVRDPNYTDTVLDDPSTAYAQTWAQLSYSQGGLDAQYASTPEFGEQYNDSIDAQHQRGANFGLSFYDAIVAPPNQAPVVMVGADQILTWPNKTVSLTGTVSDDGLPVGVSVTYTWTVTTGTGVTIANNHSLSTTATFSTTGVYTLRLTAGDTALTAYQECTIVINPASGGGQAFGGTPWPVPGQIEAENYDLGGELIAYHDTTTGNSGGGYRSDDVDIRATTDVGGGYLVKDIAAGEWLNYTVNITAAGNYIISVRSASTSDGSVHFLLDGNTLTSSFTLPASGDYDAGITTAAPVCYLPAGIHVIRMCFDVSSFNVNWFNIAAVIVNTAPTVNAGSNQSLTMPTNSVTLSGTVSDDGLPNPPAATTCTWSKSSGPGTVTFANNHAAATTATFSTIGTYVLRLTASDSNQSSSSTCQVILAAQPPPNTAPTITMPTNVTTSMPGASSAGAVALNATVSDDGRVNPLVLTWSLLSYSGVSTTQAVTFTSTSAASTAAGFNRAGTYTLQLDANDGSLHTARTMTVTVQNDPRADFDKNAAVDGIDFLVWQRNYNHGTAASGAAIVDANFNDPNYAKANGDANGDGKVDGSDFLIWQQDYAFCH